VYVVHCTDSGGLQLFVGKDGSAVLRSTARMPAASVTEPTTSCSSTLPYS